MNFFSNIIAYIMSFINNQQRENLISNLEEVVKFSKSAIYKKIKKDVGNKKYLDAINDKYLNTNNPSLKIIIDSINYDYNVFKNSAFNKKYWFITINLNDSYIDKKNNVKYITPFALTKIMNKITKKVWLISNKYMYSFEQRSESIENVHGFHVHLLCEKNKKKAEVIREIYNVTKKYLSDKNKIHIKFIGTHNDFSNVYNYILGIKTDDKIKKIEIDKLWRSNNKLKDVYYNSSLPNSNIF